MDRRLKAAAKRVERRKRTLGSTYVVGLDDEVVRYVGLDGARNGGYQPVPAAMNGDAASYGRARLSNIELHQSFFARFGWWAGFRDAVMRHRVRPHLFSGIEYQMFIFVLGPLFDAVLPFVVFSVVGLLLFEVALVYKLLLSSKDFDRQMRRLAPSPSAARAEVTAAATAAGAPGAGQVPDAPSGPPEQAPTAADDPADAAVAR
jgi:hypothetical protein